MEAEERLGRVEVPAREVEGSPQEVEGCAHGLKEETGGEEQRQEIVVICPPGLAERVGKTFALLLADQQLPASVVWSGSTWHSVQGIVVIAWDGKIPESFLWQLEIDTELSDFLWYDRPSAMDGVYRTLADPPLRASRSSDSRPEESPGEQ